MSIRPIPTTYRGHRFRSRLEARYAVFFERAGIQALYEHQGFMIGDRSYLPDFYLPALGWWIEVKGTESELDYELMRVAPEYLPDGALLILGPLPGAPEGGNWAWNGLVVEDDGDGPFTCGNWWEFHDGGIVPATETSCAPPSQTDDDGWLIPALNMAGDAPARIVDAYRSARSARFEHGEEGAA